MAAKKTAAPKPVARATTKAAPRAKAAAPAAQGKTRPKPTRSGRGRAKAFVALLRGINVGGNKPLPMARLRELAEELGFTHAQTYIQSGNLVFASELDAAAAEHALEAGIVDAFGFSVEVMVRSAADFQVYAKGGAYAEAARKRPSQVVLGLTKQKVRSGAVEQLAKYVTLGERISALRDGLWIDFPGGIGKSKLTPAVLDRAVGSTLTARNFSTVKKLAELVADVERQANEG